MYFENVTNVKSIEGDIKGDDYKKKKKNHPKYLNNKNL